VRHLTWRTTAAGNIALIVPGAAVAITVAAQQGRAVTAGLVGVAALLVAVVVVVPALRIRTRLTADGIVSHWTRRFGADRIDRDRVHRAIIRTVYNSDGITTYRHLFLLDGEGRTVHRMTGRWWDVEQLRAVARHFDVALETQEQPVHLVELRRTAREQLRWSERHRITATAVAITVAFLLCVAFSALTTWAIWP
jgi:hypothetical protein